MTAVTILEFANDLDHLFSRDIFEDTKVFLLKISSHLSTRRRYSKTEFLVTIQIEDSENPVITMNPRIFICPDRYHKKRVDQVNVIDHILNNHVRSSISLVTGTYQYMLSSSKKYRRWVKIK